MLFELSVIIPDSQIDPLYAENSNQSIGIREFYLIVDYCVENCYLCSVEEVCDKCIQGFVNFEGKCLDKCPEGYLEV